MGTIEIIGTVIAAVGTVLAGVWFIVRKAQQLAVNDYRLDNMERDVSGLKGDVSNLKLDVSNLKSDVSNLKIDVSALKSDMSEVRSDIYAIKTVLIKKFPSAAEVFSMKKSPRRLNELGEKVFSQINGKEFLESNRKFFFDQIDSRKPKTALDVEMSANIVCDTSTDSDIFNGIKSFVYNAPSLSITDENGESRRYDISIGDVCYILSLPLRDMYLDAHPEIER